MAIDLTRLRHKPTSKTFYYKESVVGLERTDDPRHAIMSLDLEYITTREYRQLVAQLSTQRTNRRAVSKSGVKAFLTSQDQVARDVVFKLLRGWKMTVRAAVLLQTEADFSKLAPTDEIEFNDENIAFMVEHSNFADQIDALISDYDSWFDMNQSDEDGDEEADSAGNSPSGPGGSTDESPAEPASATT